jgi:kinesin family member C1
MTALKEKTTNNNNNSTMQSAGKPNLRMLNDQNFNNGDNTGTFVFNTAMKERSKIHALAQALYDRSENAQEESISQQVSKMLTWKPTVSKASKEYPQELLAYALSQKKLLKELTRVKDRLILGSCRIEKDLVKANNRFQQQENNTSSFPVTQKELAEIQSEREKLAQQQKDSQEHLMKVQEAEDMLQKATEALEGERARIREEEHNQVMLALQKKIATAEARVEAAMKAESKLQEERNNVEQLRSLEDLGVAEASESAKAALAEAKEARAETEDAKQKLFDMKEEYANLKGRYESLNEKYASEKELWNQEKRELDSSRTTLQTTLEKMNSKSEQMEREMKDLFLEKQALEQNLQSEIDSVIAEAQKEKEIALENLEQTLTAEAREELEEQKAAWQAQMDARLNEQLGESKTGFNQRFEDLNQRLIEQKKQHEEVRKSMLAEAEATKAQLNAEHQAALKQATHAAELEGAAAKSALVHAERSIEQLTHELQKVRETLSSDQSERGSSARDIASMLSEHTERIAAQFVRDKKEALEEKERELQREHNAMVEVAKANFEREMESSLRNLRSELDLKADQEKNFALEQQAATLRELSAEDKMAALDEIKHKHSADIANLKASFETEAGRRVREALESSKGRGKDAMLAAEAEAKAQFDKQLESKTEAFKAELETQKSMMTKESSIALENLRQQLLSEAEAERDAVEEQVRAEMSTFVERSKQQNLRAHRAEMEKLAAELERKASEARNQAVNEACENLRSEMEDEKQAIIEATVAELSAKSQAELAREKAKIQASAFTQHSAQINELREALENERLKIVAMESAAAAAASMNAMSNATRSVSSEELETAKANWKKYEAKATILENTIAQSVQAAMHSKEEMFIREKAEAITKLTIEYETKIKRVVEEERERLHLKNAIDPSVNSQGELELREQLLKVQEEKNVALRNEKEVTRLLEQSKATVESLKSKASHSDQKSQTLMDLTNQAERAKAEANATLQRAQKIEEEAMRNADKLHEMEQQLLEAEEIRRAMHNQIQELRGNVRVFARVRPPFVGEEDYCAVDALDKDSVAVTVPELEPRVFNFDRVFDASASQSDVFEEVESMITSAMDGYKVCLFSYGQTGSGKTHTMLGSGDGEDRGIIPRAIGAILERKEKLLEKGYEYEIEASYVEIYNDQIRDLLGGPNAKHSERHNIVTAPEGGCPTVAGVVREYIDSVSGAATLVRKATAARAVEATEMNAHSSRSHTLFLVYITGVHIATGTQLSGCLNLVDLAGSERTKRSGAQGTRMSEACAINKSLSCLGDVFASIARGDKHVPYRNSKLTYLLAPCLGGDGKTLMVVNVAPEEESAEETVASLRFASTVNAVELGHGKRAKRNVTSMWPTFGNSQLSKEPPSTVQQRRLSSRNMPPSTASRRQSRGGPQQHTIGSFGGNNNSQQQQQQTGQKRGRATNNEVSGAGGNNNAKTPRRTIGGRRWD